MFRRDAKSLPPDPVFPADLKAVGYFINETGHIRKIANPKESFQYWLTNNDRYNEVHREAMHICTREAVNERMAALGIQILNLPQMTATKPENQPHIPILITPAEILKTRKRVIVIINDDTQDLGVLAYRILHRAAGLNGGSVVNFAKTIIHRSLYPDTVNAGQGSFQSNSQEVAQGMQEGISEDVQIEIRVEVQRAAEETAYRSLLGTTEEAKISSQPRTQERAQVAVQEEISVGVQEEAQAGVQEGSRFDWRKDCVKIDPKNAPGLIVMNPGQINYSPKFNQAMSWVSWLAQPRESAIHDPVVADPIHNTVEGQRTAAEHVKFVFDNVIYNSSFVAPNAEIYIVGIQGGAVNLIRLLDDKRGWNKYSRNITAMALMQPGTMSTEIKNPSLSSFLRSRARCWVKSQFHERGHPVDCPIIFQSVHKESNDTATQAAEALEELVKEHKPIDWLEKVQVQSVDGLLVGEGSDAAQSPVKRMLSPTPLDKGKAKVVEPKTPGDSDYSVLSPRTIYSVTPLPNPPLSNSQGPASMDTSSSQRSSQVPLLERPSPPLRPQKLQPEGTPVNVGPSPAPILGNPFPALVRDEGKRKAVDSVPVTMPQPPRHPMRPLPPHPWPIPISARTRAGPSRPIGVRTEDSTELLKETSEAICPIFTSGPAVDAPECIFPAVYDLVLDFFEEVARDPFHYQNPYFDPQSTQNQASPPQSPPVSAYEAHDVHETGAQLDTQEGGVALDQEDHGNTSGWDLINQPTSQWQSVGTGSQMEFAGESVDVDIVNAAGLEEPNEDKVTGNLLSALSEEGAAWRRMDSLQDSLARKEEDEKPEIEEEKRKQEDEERVEWEEEKLNREELEKAMKTEAHFWEAKVGEAEKVKREEEDKLIKEVLNEIKQDEERKAEKQDLMT
ncbi:hypothetical protein K432DRAFT_443837 [Lepidopterella palustris CBS 459.81]|uniref:Arb2 domain-containing protein n=1 Tax=Lepidopterella palustris CBS 459.81 TaxID=1314670 RepID=A0A8E2E924_9PEZI|nr:hypothetical protein K432DRAFT_443837 [Lepidopterella palustris CBS 459.81]